MRRWPRARQHRRVAVRCQGATPLCGGSSHPAPPAQHTKSGSMGVAEPAVCRLEAGAQRVGYEGAAMARPTWHHSHKHDRDPWGACICCRPGKARWSTLGKSGIGGYSVRLLQAARTPEQPGAGLAGVDAAQACASRPGPRRAPAPASVLSQLRCKRVPCSTRGSAPLPGTAPPALQWTGCPIPWSPPSTRTSWSGAEVQQQ